MIATLTRPAPVKPAPRRRFRIDAPLLPSEVYPESSYLRHWAARQASRYQDLLSTIAGAPLPDRRD
jgi:hypothetical protein